VGAAAIAVALAVSAFVPGYFSAASLSRWQWALVGALLSLAAIVAASVLWSISPALSLLEASRTAMYVGAFVLLLPAATRWGSLIVDATVFGALLPPALYGLAQKIFPMAVQYTGFGTLEFDPKVSSTVGYHPAFGMMCAMGALLVVARVGSFRSLRSAPLRALFSATGVLFLVALYFSFSRGALPAFGAGVIVLLALAKYRFEVLGNLAITALPALWVISQAREYPGLVSRDVTRPMSLEVIETDGLALQEPLLKGVLLALVAQVLFTLLVWAFARFVPGGARGVLRVAGTVIAAGAIAVGLFLGWNAFQQAGGYDELRSQITATDSELQSEALATDQTRRFSSPSAATRIVLWEIAWKNFREHPLTGTGGDTYQVVYEEYRYHLIYEEKAADDLRKVLHPHSVWMSLLSDTGIFAFMAFAAFCMGCLALAFYSAVSGTRCRRSRALLAGSAAAAATYLVSSSIDWHWYIPASTLPFFALAAVAAGTRRRRERSTDP
jgi:O-antigen ligase